MKVCQLTRISTPAPKICLNVLLTGDVFYMGKVIHGPWWYVPPWPNRTHDHSGRQHRAGILRVYDGLECESLAS